MYGRRTRGGIQCRLIRIPRRWSDGTRRQWLVARIEVREKATVWSQRAKGERIYLVNLVTTLVWWERFPVVTSYRMLVLQTHPTCKLTHFFFKTDGDV